MEAKKQKKFAIRFETKSLKDIFTLTILSALIFTILVVSGMTDDIVEEFKYYTDQYFSLYIVSLFFSILVLTIFSIRRWMELKEEIQKRKNIENKVASSRAQLEAVLDGVPDMILQVDNNMRIRWANKAALELNPGAIGFKANTAFDYLEGSFLDSYCKWAMDIRNIKKGITYKPFSNSEEQVSYWEGIGVPLIDKHDDVYGAIAIARNITSRMRVEHTWNLLSSIVESTADAIYGVHWDGTILSWNPGAEKIYGYKTEEVVGRQISMLVPVLQRRELLEIIEYVSKKEIIQRIETNRIKRDGEEIIISQTICPFVDATGNKVGVSIIDRDITEAKASEVALRESEARFKELFEHMSSGVAVFQPSKAGQDFILKNVNEAVLSIEGMEVDDILNKSITNIAPFADLSGFLEVLSAVYKSEQPRFDTLYMMDNEKIIAWREHYTYKLPSGEIVTIYDDVTESIESERALRLSEKKFRSLVTTAPDSIILTNSDGKIVEVNEAFLSMMKYSREEIIGSSILDYLPTRTAKARAVKMIQALHVNKHLPITEFSTRDKFGLDIPVGLSLEALKEEDGSVSNYICIVRDITERKKFEEELKKSRLQLRLRGLKLEEAREEERKRIAFEIHDELGYMLTALKLDFSWMEQRIDPEEKKIHERFQSIEDLIDQLVKKVRTISTKLRPSILDHFGIVAAIEWQADEFQRRTGVRCIVSADPKEIKLSEEKNTAIFRIFQEALTNITRHAKASRVDVNLTAITDVLELRVRDNGKGMPESRLKNTETYGLLGIRERAKFMGGVAEILSKEGKGTSIILTVPLSNEENKDG